MDSNTKQNENQLPEAPASITLNVKTPKGFPGLLTLRDSKMKDLILNIETIEKLLDSRGWTPHEKTFGRREPKPVEYVKDKVCELDEGKLVIKVTKEGKKFVECENRNYDFKTKIESGCKFIDWDWFEKE